MVAIDLVMIPYGNSGGRISHLGGAFLGFFYAKNISNGKDIGVLFEKFWTYLIKFSRPKLSKVYKNEVNDSRQNKPNNQQEIDRILDKISKSGYESLTKKEKETLFDAGK